MPYLGDNVTLFYIHQFLMWTIISKSSILMIQEYFLNIFIKINMD